MNWTKRLIAARRSRRAFGRGGLRFLYPANRKVIAYLREWQDETILCVANLSRSAQAVALDLAEFRGRQVIEVLGRSVFLPVGEQPYQLTLPPHSFFWFEMPPPESDIGDVTQASHPELVTLVMPHGWADLSGRHNLPQLERDVIPAFLPRQRWFAAKDRQVEAGWILAHAELPGPATEAASGSFLALVAQASWRGTLNPGPDRGEFPPAPLCLSRGRS